MVFIDCMQLHVKHVAHVNKQFVHTNIWTTPNNFDTNGLPSKTIGYGVIYQHVPNYVLIRVSTCFTRIGHKI